MGHARHSWREACASALTEPDPKKVPSRLEYAISALERRYAEWESHPGTSAELSAIQKTVLALERLMKEKLGSSRALPPVGQRAFSDTTDHSVATELGHVRRLFLVLRS
jgi:hypothetical protein